MNSRVLQSSIEQSEEIERYSDPEIADDIHTVRRRLEGLMLAIMGADPRHGGDCYPDGLPQLCADCLSGIEQLAERFKAERQIRIAEAHADERAA